MGLVFEVKVGKKRTIVLPKAVVEELGIVEGSKLKLEVHGETIILKPIRDAIYLALHGEKYAEVTLEELERESIRQQGMYIGEVESTN